MRACLHAAAIAFIVMAVATTTDADGRRGQPHAPRLLSQTGLYRPGTLTVDVRNRPYSPQYPLWTDGAAKRRWLRLPDGAVIDARDDAEWRFPVGTRLWKEFAFDGRPVETRLLWRARDDRWVFAAYRWKDDGTDAVLAPETGVPNAAALGAGRQHRIPSIDDCHACHEDGRVLGVTALQLSTDRDPLAPHAEPLEAGMLTVETLLDEQRLRPGRTDLRTSPPRIPAATPVARAALGYLSANCGICHRDGVPIDTRLRLLPDAGGSPQRMLRILTSAPVSWDIPTVGEGETRFVTPGHPELSSIVARMQSRRPSSQMPPLGTVTVDREAVALITEWIRDMR